MNRALIDMENLSNEELREQLARYGINVGPVVATTRNVYLKRLRALQGGGGDKITQTPVLPAQEQVFFDDAEHDIYLLDEEEQYHGSQGSPRRRVFRGDDEMDEDYHGEESVEYMSDEFQSFDNRDVTNKSPSYPRYAADQSSYSPASDAFIKKRTGLGADTMTSRFSAASSSSPVAEFPPRSDSYMNVRTMLQLAFLVFAAVFVYFVLTRTGTGPVHHPDEEI